MDIAYKKFACNRSFGVELEVSNTVTQNFIRKVVEASSDRPVRTAIRWAQSRGNDYWHIKHDSTCGVKGKGHDKGWEVASFKGSTVADMLHMADVSNKLRLAGLEVNDNCGLHVHVEVNDYSPRDVGKLIGYWVKMEELFLEAVPFRRSINNYCFPLRYDLPKKYLTPLELWRHFNPKSLSPYENPERWRTVNFVNYATALIRKNYGRRTIEFRLPEGTLWPDDVKNWIRLFVHFVDQVKLLPDPADINEVNLEDTLAILGLNHMPDRFFIFSEGLFATKTWFLERVKRYGSLEQTGQAIRILNRMWEPEKTFCWY